MTVRRAGVSEGGFTIIEALVALAIGGFVITSLATITGQWIRSWRNGYPVLQRSEMLAASLNRIVEDLSAVRFMPGAGAAGIAFNGEEASVTFVRRALPVERPDGLEMVRLAPATSSSDATLVRTRAPVQLEPILSAPFDPAPVVLLREPLFVRFAYADINGQWRNNWLAASRIPRLIRIAVADRRTGRDVLAPVVVRVHVDSPVQCASLPSARACDAAIEGAADQPGAEPGQVLGSRP